MEMVWELALRVILKSVDQQGRWTEHDYIKNAKEIIRQSSEAIDAIFTQA